KAPNRLTYRLSRRCASWLSTSLLRGRWALPFRLSCSTSPMRCTNGDVLLVCKSLLVAQSRLKNRLLFLCAFRSEGSFKAAKYQYFRLRMSRRHGGRSGRSNENGFSVTAKFDLRSRIERSVHRRARRGNVVCRDRFARRDRKHRGLSTNLPG